MGEFEQRFSAREAELKDLYLNLYHGDTGAYDYFCSMLKRLHDARPEGLRELDRKRLAQPQWYRERDLLGMLMYVDCFAGSLKGVEEKLPYLQETGVNYLHLMPLLKSPKGRSDGGYAVSDFTKVQETLGTMEDLSALAQACHDRGMSLCLDFVMNHTSEDHPWAVAARKGDPLNQSRYFFYDNWDIPNCYEQTVPQVFPTTAPGNFTWCPEAGKVVMTTFYPYQWDLNYANPMVFNDMTEYMLNLTNHGVDIIRLDAVPYIWKEMWTSCRNLPQVHTLVRMMRIVSEIVCPCTLLLGEVVMEPSKVVPYFGSVERPECHLLYNVTTMASTWHTVATRDVRLMEHQLRQVFALPPQYTFLNYLRCHDDIGWGLDYGFLSQFGWGEISHKRFLNDCLTGTLEGSDARGELYNDDPRLGDARLCGTTASLCGLEAALYEKDEHKTELALALIETLHAFMLTLSGIPVLYSGDEIGQLNDYGYHRDPDKRQDSRYLHRGAMNWEQAARRAQPGTVEARIFESILRLERLRRQEEVFSPEAECRVLDTGNFAVLGIVRKMEGRQLVALFNFSEQAQVAWIGSDRKATDLISGDTATAVRWELRPHGFCWLVQEME